jgi:hypothetical protein
MSLQMQIISKVGSISNFLLDSSEHEHYYSRNVNILAIFREILGTAMFENTGKPSVIYAAYSRKPK